MSGIYIHIPFCKKACTYCNFHFSTTFQKYREEMINAIIKEINTRNNYLPTKEITSIYFGGGTPSLLNEAELARIMEAIKDNYTFDLDNIEITLEANPDDLNKDKIKMLANNGVNRLSIGIQSFDENDLTKMNRSHNSIQARNSIENSLAIGINNFSVDLIFGLPDTSTEKWQNNLNIVTDYEIPHLSIYNLTVEPQTKLSSDVTKNKIIIPKDEVTAKQFYQARTFLKENQYEHYEISNYAKTGNLSKHNTNYWKSKPYIGIGPGAHSYNMNSRQWNIANNKQYIKHSIDGTISYGIEQLSPSDIYNEYILTRLRTKWGVDLADLHNINPKYKVFFSNQIDQFISKKQIENQGTIYTIKEDSLIIADSIMSDLLYV